MAPEEFKNSEILSKDKQIIEFVKDESEKFFF